MKPTKQQLINGIRAWYLLPDTVTDQQIEAELMDSFGAAMVNLYHAKQAFKSAVMEACFGQK